ncbi:MAG: hypothetical protein JWL62_659, partial [Hyphomicrobiales bacterium]|nr:hypothetical protein [Hyphomicrobiales bacterium]
MTALADLTDWCHQERQRKTKQLAALEAGRLKLAEDRGHGWVDHTAESISRLKLHIGELDEHLRTYDAERTQGA